MPSLTRWIKCWTKPSFFHQGQFFTIPPVFTRWNHQQTIAYFSSDKAGRKLDEVLKIGAVDPYGRVLATTRLFEPAAITVDVRLLDGTTIYGRAGDVIVWLSFAVAFVASVCACVCATFCWIPVSRNWPSP